MVITKRKRMTEILLCSFFITKSIKKKMKHNKTISLLNAIVKHKHK